MIKTSFMPDQPVISFCIVSRDVRALLRDALSSLYEHAPHVPFEVIVTDNGSADGTQAMLAEHFPAVQIIRLEGNGGYTMPMNRALQQARGQYLVQLNPDTLTLAGTFDRLYELMEANPGVGICVPKVLNRDGTLQKQCRRSAARPWDVISYFLGLPRLFPGSARFGGYLLEHMPEDESYPVEAVSGSCMFIRRAVVEQIGYLDPVYFAYQEDSDFCFRARQAGWQIYYFPTAHIIHYGGEGGSGRTPYRGIYEWHRSYFIYYRKHLARDYFFLGNWLYYALMAAKLGYSLLRAFFQKEKIVGTPKPKKTIETAERS